MRNVSLLLSLILMAINFSCSPDTKPNILFILVDDLGWKDLGCYGSDFYDTPNLDKLAEHSVRFTNAYSASPVCSPTRAAIMTGKHPARINITDWIPGANIRNTKLRAPEDIHNLPHPETTLAEAFQQEGYKTFFAGKWHLGETEEYWPEFHGFDINKGGIDWGQPKRNTGGNGYYSPYNNPRLENGPVGEYLTDRLCNESLRFIENSGQDPFFLYLAFYTVHTPIMGCDKYDEEYLQKSQELPDSGQLISIPESSALTRINQSDPKYAAMVRSLDTNVGRLMKKLEDSGKLENTIIVFTSDNGGLTTTGRAGPTAVLPLRAGKGWCYEGGIRIPLMISYPGFSQSGETSNIPAISMDLYPTLLELAGLETDYDQHRDGMSLVPYLKDPDKEGDRTLVWHYPHYHGSKWRPGSAIRENNWKLIEFYEDRRVELYDLENDLEEKKDLSQVHPAVATGLKDLMHKELDEMGARYPVEN